MPDLVDLIITLAPDNLAPPELAEKLAKAAELSGQQASDMAGLQPGQSMTIVRAASREHGDNLAGKLTALGFQCQLATSISDAELSLFDDIDALELEQPIVDEPIAEAQEQAPAEQIDSVSFDDDFAELGEQASHAGETAAVDGSEPSNKDTAPAAENEDEATPELMADHDTTATATIDASVDEAPSGDTVSAENTGAVRPSDKNTSSVDHHGGVDTSLMDELTAAMAGCDTPTPKRNCTGSGAHPAEVEATPQPDPDAPPAAQPDVQMAIVNDEPVDKPDTDATDSPADVASLVAGSVALQSTDLAGLTLSPLENSTAVAPAETDATAVGSGDAAASEAIGINVQAPTLDLQHELQSGSIEPEPLESEPDLQPAPQLRPASDPQPQQAKLQVHQEVRGSAQLEQASSDQLDNPAQVDLVAPEPPTEQNDAAPAAEGADAVASVLQNVTGAPAGSRVPLGEMIPQSEEEALRRGREEIAQIKNRLDADKQEEDVVARQFQLKRRATEPKVLAVAGSFLLLAVGIGGWMSMDLLKPPAPTVDIQSQPQIVANKVRETPENDPVFKLALQRARASDSALGLEVATLLEKLGPVLKPDTLSQLLSRYQLEPIAAAALPAAKTSSTDAAQSPADYLDSWLQRQALLKQYLELLARVQAEQGLEFASFVVQDTSDSWLRLMGRHQLTLALYDAGEDRSVEYQLEQASREAYSIQAPAERVIAIADTALIESVIGFDDLAEDSFLEASILGGTLVEAAERVVANATIASFMYRAGDLHGATSHFKYAQLAVASLDAGVARDLGHLQLAENLALAGFSGRALAEIEMIDDPYIAVPASLAVASVFRRMGDQNSVRSAVVLAHRLGVAIVKPAHRERLLARVNATLNQ